MWLHVICLMDPGEGRNGRSSCCRLSSLKCLLDRGHFVFFGLVSNLAQWQIVPCASNSAIEVHRLLDATRKDESRVWYVCQDDVLRSSV